MIKIMSRYKVRVPLIAYVEVEIVAEEPCYAKEEVVSDVEDLVHLIRDHDFTGLVMSVDEGGTEVSQVEYMTNVVDTAEDDD